MVVLFVNDSPALAVTTKSVPSGSALPAKAAREAIIALKTMSFFMSLPFVYASATRLPLKPMPFWKFRFTMPVFYHITAQGAIANRHVAAQERGPPSAGRLVLPGGPFQRTITIVPESAATA